MVVAKVWTMKRQFKGMPTPEDFELVEQALPPTEDGDFVVESSVLSVDPYNRAFARSLPDGSPMIGFNVGKVVESKNADFPVGCYAVTHSGWRTHTLVKKKDLTDKMFGFVVYRIPDELLKKHALSYFVGSLGMPGATAYYGLIVNCAPKAGETLVVNAAAGAVGSLVGQFGKVLGLKVIGYAGSDDKCEWLKSIGFDFAFNYKKVDLGKSLSEAAPQGVDCFYDNVGGDFAVTVYQHMNRYGRICQTGAISAYNATGPVMIPIPHGIFVGQELKLTGFMFSTYVPRYQEFIDQVAQWIEQGKVKAEETKYNGFCEMPKALIDQLNGVNVGKPVVFNNCNQHKDGCVMKM